MLYGVVDRQSGAFLLKSVLNIPNLVGVFPTKFGMFNTKFGTFARTSLRPPTKLGLEHTKLGYFHNSFLIDFTCTFRPNPC